MTHRQLPSLFSFSPSFLVIRNLLCLICFIFFFPNNILPPAPLPPSSRLRIFPLSTRAPDIPLIKLDARGWFFFCHPPEPVLHSIETSQKVRKQSPPLSPHLQDEAFRKAVSNKTREKRRGVGANHHRKPKRCSGTKRVKRRLGAWHELRNRRGDAEGGRACCHQSCMGE